MGTVKETAVSNMTFSIQPRSQRDVVVRMNEDVADRLFTVLEWVNSLSLTALFDGDKVAAHDAHVEIGQICKFLRENL